MLGEMSGKFSRNPWITSRSLGENCRDISGGNFEESTEEFFWGNSKETFSPISEATHDRFSKQNTHEICENIPCEEILKKKTERFL